MLRQLTDYEEWRLTGIGSSNAAAIVNECKWTKGGAQELWELFTRRRDFPKEDYPMRRGRAVEPVARRCHEERTGVRISSNVVNHATHPFIRASLDGINWEREHATELKAPGIQDHSAALLGQIPQGYCSWQLVHQMAVLNAPEIYYHSFYSFKWIPADLDPSPFTVDPEKRSKSTKDYFKTWEPIPKELVWRPAYLEELRKEGKSLIEHLQLGPGNCVDLIVERNKQLEDYLMEAEIRFWEYVQRDVPPPKNFMKNKKPNLRLVTEMANPIFKIKKSDPRAVVERFQKSEAKRRETASKLRGQARPPMEEVARAATQASIPYTSMPGSYTAAEVIEILQRAKELGVQELRLNGFELRCK